MPSNPGVRGWPRRSTVKTTRIFVAVYIRAIGALGGHLKNNGDPGWEVIWRSFRTLRIMVSGFLLARRQM